MAEINERCEELLGKFLLGQASEEEKAELLVSRQHNARLDEVMGLLERSSASFEESVLGETTMQTELAVPDYFKPLQLAQRLRRMSRNGFIGLLCMGIFIALIFVIRVIETGNAQDLDWADWLLLGSALFWIALPCLIYYGCRDKHKKIQEGGTVWAETVAALKAREKRLYGKRALITMTIGAVIILASILLMTVPDVPHKYCMFLLLFGFSMALHVPIHRWVQRKIRSE